MPDKIVILSEHVSIKEIIRKLTEVCADGKGYFSWFVYKGEEYFCCGGDCQSCGVREVIRLLKNIEEEKPWNEADK